METTAEVTRQLSKDVDYENKISKLDLMDKCRILHPTITEFTFPK